MYYQHNILCVFYQNKSLSILLIVWQNLPVISSLTANCSSSCAVPSWPITNVPRVVSTPWNRRFTYPGNWTTRSSCLSAVLYSCRLGGRHDVTSRRRDVTDSVLTWNVSVVDSVGSHFSWSEWSSADTRQIQSGPNKLPKSATYSWRSSRQTTMSRKSFIPVMLMTTSSGLYVSVLHSRIVEDPAQTTYMMLSKTVTPRTQPTTYDITHITLWYHQSSMFVSGRKDNNSLHNIYARIKWLHAVI